MYQKCVFSRCTIPVSICVCHPVCGAVRRWVLAMACPFHLHCTAFQPPQNAQPQHPFLIDSASGATSFRQLHIPSITALRERQLFPQEVQAAVHQIAQCLELGGPVEKMWFFQIPPRPHLSVLNCSTMYQYDILKVWLEKIDQNPPVICPKH